MRAGSEIPKNTSDRLDKANSEAIKATQQKANRGKKVLGKRRLNRFGKVPSKNNINKGYKDSGRTSVSPPKPLGKNGKLVTGKATRKSTQAIAATLFCSQIRFSLFIHFQLVINLHQFLENPQQ
jgi:hypothetical protein